MPKSSKTYPIKKTIPKDKLNTYCLVDKKYTKTTSPSIIKTVTNSGRESWRISGICDVCRNKKSSFIKVEDAKKYI